MFRITIEGQNICKTPVSPMVAELMRFEEFNPHEDSNRIVIGAPDEFRDIMMETVVPKLGMEQASEDEQALLMMAYHHFLLQTAVQEILTEHVKVLAKDRNIGEDAWTQLLSIAKRLLSGHELKL